MTIALERLADGSISDRNFQKLASLVLDPGGQSAGIRFGTATVTWPGGSTISTVLPVTHGLGTTPVITLAGDAAGGALTHIPVWAAFSPGATSFSVAAETGDLSSPGAGTTRNFYWLVIG